MQRLQRLIVIFSVLFAVFILGPALLGQRFQPYPLMDRGDVFDLFTPLVLIPAYWLLLQLRADRLPTRREMLAFLVLAALWVEAQGMHLVGNSIGHLTGGLAGSDVAALTHFYDEVLSHYMWHAALIGLSVLLVIRQWKNPFTAEASSLRLELGAGILHGINYSLMVLEGATTPLGVPFAVLAVLFGLAWGRGKLRQQPILAFFLVAYAVAVLVFLGWGLYWGGLPEPSAKGLI